MKFIRNNHEVLTLCLIIAAIFAIASSAAWENGLAR